MSQNLPYMLSVGKIVPILEKAATAQKPAKFTHDYLTTILGFKSNSDRAIISLLVRMGFLSNDKTPTDRYSQFKNKDLRKQAIADGMREAFAEIFEINEFAYKCSKDQIEGIVAQITGLEADDRVLKAIAGTFWNLLTIADFESEASVSRSSNADEGSAASAQNGQHQFSQSYRGGQSFGLNYSIFLNLPETTDVEVYNAIFQSLRTNLLQDN